MRAHQLCICVLLCTIAFTCVSSRPLYLRNYVGSLNHRFTAEQMATQELEPQWLTQKLDHQDLSSNVTFQQLYYVNDTYFNPQRPRVFLMIGGEGPLSPAYLGSAFYMGVQAAQFGALQVALEHRFYGSSVPNNDSSTPNLKFLSSDQALEDLVVFHEHITQQYNLPANTQWITFGGSYSGSLSAWARLKYPNLFIGAIASSAPVQAELDFFQYMEVVAASLGPQCSSIVAVAQATIDQLASTGTPGFLTLQQAFNTCEPVGNEQDYATFVSAVSNPFCDTVQYNDDAGRTSFDIGTICGILANNTQGGFWPLVDVWNAYLNNTGQSGACTDISYKNYIQSMQETSAGRSWTWQTCQEFGYFQTGESNKQPFSPNITLDYYVDQCQDIFGIDGMTPSVDYINNFYGGNEIVTSNTVFTAGTVDPWSTLRTNESFPLSRNSISMFISGSAHCADLYVPHPSDVPGLAQARSTQDAFISIWLEGSSIHEKVTSPKPSHKQPHPKVLEEF